MSARVREGASAEGLDGVLLRFVEHEERIERLRDGLGAFSHRCRNLLNGMKMGLYFVRRTGTGPLPVWWDEVEANYRGIEHLFDALQQIYRPMALTMIRADFGALVRSRLTTWREWAGDNGTRIEVAPPAREAPVDFDPDCLGMALDSFVRWRTRMLAPAGSALLGWQLAGEEIRVEWTEASSQRGVCQDSDDEDAERGRSDCGGIDALASPLLGRVMTAHGGRLQSRCEPDYQLQCWWPRLAQAPTAALDHGRGAGLGCQGRSRGV